MIHKNKRPDRQADVLIIGAGLAGLSAAKKCLEAGKRVILLEARDRVGGRICTVDGPEGEKLDLGAQWIGANQHHIKNLVDDLGLLTFRQYSKGKKILDLDGKQKRYERLIPKLPINQLLELDRVIKKLDKEARKIPLDRPWKAKNAQRLDSRSVEDWKRRNVHGKDSSALFDAFVKMVFCAEPSEISLLFFLYYLHSGGGFEQLADSEQGAQSTRIMGGSQQICELMARPLGRNLVLNAAVSEVINDEDGVDVKTSKGVFSGKYLIMAMAPALVDRIRFSPALPAKRAALGQRMPMGSVIKTIAIYDKPFWRTQGFSGEVVSNSRPLSAVFDDLPKDSHLGALLGFVVSANAVWFGTLEEEERKRLVLNQLAGYFGKAALEPMRYLEKDWPQEEWSRGCYAGLPGPGVYTQYGESLRRPVNRCHWAGTETAERWNGYMDGAVESGYRAAGEVLRRLE